MAKATKIMVIRHAEKPEGAVQGVDADGNDGKEFLIVQGWQRAGYFFKAPPQLVTTVRGGEVGAPPTGTATKTVGHRRRVDMRLRARRRRGLVRGTVHAARRR